ncbi:F-box protein [Forsythia ovata]|uniref:F-box protein n=1 Tax=Forsythia ovata TaxID=205694 RepID=A0ABD1WDJ0_9LAMI
MDFQRELKKQKCDKEEGDQPTNLISCLPDEIALEIFSRLPIKSVLQSRFACRHWRLLTHDPYLVNMHLSQALISQRLCLILHSDDPIRNQLHFAEFSDVGDIQTVRKIDTPFASSMPEFSIIGSCNGLLCLVDSLLSDTIYIYNPFTRDYKVLPNSTVFEDQNVIFGFGFNPINKDYKVIKIVYYHKTYNLDILMPSRRLMDISSQRSDVQIYNLGSNEWRSIGEAPYIIDKRSLPGVLVSGRLHWLSRLGKYNGRYNRIIISFDLSDDSFREIPKPGGSKIWVHFIVVVLGCCLSVAVPLPGGNGAVEIWVMKEYGVQESWVKEFTLGAYIPRFIHPQFQRSFRLRKNFLTVKLLRNLCLLKNGEILVEYRGGNLVSYNRDTRIFKELSFRGMSRLYQTTVHVGSLYPVVQS